jgi:hypothetical protein
MTNVKYESKLPQVNHRTIYELLNKLTNRKPVKVTVERDLFRDLNSDINNTPRIYGEHDTFEKIYKPRTNNLLYKEKYPNLSINKKTLRPIENNDERLRLKKLVKF